MKSENIKKGFANNNNSSRSRGRMKKGGCKKYSGNYKCRQLATKNDDDDDDEGHKDEI